MSTAFLICWNVNWKLISARLFDYLGDSRSVFLYKLLAVNQVRPKISFSLLAFFGAYPSKSLSK